MAAESEGKYRAPALDKGLDILEFLADSPTGLTQGEIAKGLGRTPNEIYRMLDTLVRRHYVTRSPEGDKYTLSLRLLILANMHPPRRRLLDIAEPLLRRAVTRGEQSLHLALWEDGEVVIATSFSAPGNWRLSLRPGSVVGLYNTGSGRVLVTFQDADTRDRMIREHALVSGEKKLPRAEFDALIEQTRVKGYVREPSGTTVGVINISVPVLDPFGHALAVLTCPFLERIDGYKAPDLEEVTGLMQETAREIGEQLNGTIQEGQA